MYKILVIEDDRAIADAITTLLTTWDMNAHTAEACQMLPAVTDMIDELFQADAELRARVVRQVVQDGTIRRLKERLDKLRKEVPDGSESPTAAA